MGAGAAQGAAQTQAQAGVYSSDVARQTALDQIAAQAYATAPGRNIGTLGLYQLASMLGIDPRQAFPGGMQAGGAQGGGVQGTGGGGGYGGGGGSMNSDDYFNTFVVPFGFMNQGGGLDLPGISATNPASLIPGMPAPGAPGAEFGMLTRAPTLSELQMDPSFGFRLSQGQQGIENSAAARGMQLSGPALKDLGRFSQDYASQEYGNAYNRYTGQQADLFNRMASLAGIGQTASQATGATAANALGMAGQTIGQNALGIGNAMAAGQVGAANALNSGMQGAYNNWNNYQMFQGLFNQGPGTSGGSSGSTGGGYGGGGWPFLPQGSGVT